MMLGRLWLARHRGKLLVADRRTGYGLTIHRDAGVSLVGIPREGGTSILWGHTADRVAELARDLRYYRRVGPVLVVAGSDF